MAVNTNSNLSRSAHQKVLAHLRTLRVSFEQARGALMHYKDDRVDRDKLEPAARRVDDLVNLFAIGSRDPAQGLVWMSEIQGHIEQVANPKSAAALRDAEVEIAALLAVMTTAEKDARPAID
jgi:hypothetical protein